MLDNNPVNTNPPVMGGMTGLPTDPSETLGQLIEQMWKDGVSLELIVLYVTTNPEGIGAMDVVSDDISGITEEANILAQVQADQITLNNILSKIESELGVGSKVSKNWSNLNPSLLMQLKSVWTDLDISNPNNPNGVSDLSYLEQFQNQFPSLGPVIQGIQAFCSSFTHTNTTAGGTKFTFANDIDNWSFNNQGTGWLGSTPGTSMNADIAYLAEQHYDANHPSGTNTTTTTDYLQNWWSDGNAAQQLESGESQQNTTQVQAYMQLLQGFDSDAQQEIQAMATAKGVMVSNQKPT